MDEDSNYFLVGFSRIISQSIFKNTISRAFLIWSKLNHCYETVFLYRCSCKLRKKKNKGTVATGQSKQEKIQ